jgi:alpha-aminoadipate carrier protein LysW
VVVRSRSFAAFAAHTIRRVPVVKCPECDADIDLDEEEVEEGEILSCSECDAELEVTQIHPVHLIALSEDDEDEEESEDGDDDDEDEDEDKSSGESDDDAE